MALRSCSGSAQAHGQRNQRLRATHDAAAKHPHLKPRFSPTLTTGLEQRNPQMRLRGQCRCRVKQPGPHCSSLRHWQACSKLSYLCRPPRGAVQMHGGALFDHGPQVERLVCLVDGGVARVVNHLHCIPRCSQLQEQQFGAGP